MLDSAAQRANMVASQLRTNDVSDARVRNAMLDIPRERFVPEAAVPLAYMEGCIALKSGRFLMDARSFGKLLQRLFERGPFVHRRAGGRTGRGCGARGHGGTESARAGHDECRSGPRPLG